MGWGEGGDVDLDSDDGWDDIQPSLTCTQSQSQSCEEPKRRNTASDIDSAAVSSPSMFQKHPGGWQALQPKEHNDGLGPEAERLNKRFWMGSVPDEGSDRSMSDVPLWKDRDGPRSGGKVQRCSPMEHRVPPAHPPRAPASDPKMMNQPFGYGSQKPSGSPSWGNSQNARTREENHSSSQNLAEEESAQQRHTQIEARMVHGPSSSQTLYHASGVFGQASQGHAWTAERTEAHERQGSQHGEWSDGQDDADHLGLSSQHPSGARLRYEHQQRFQPEHSENFSRLPSQRASLNGSHDADPWGDSSQGMSGSSLPDVHQQRVEPEHSAIPHHGASWRKLCGPAGDLPPLRPGNKSPFRSPCVYHSTFLIHLYACRRIGASSSAFSAYRHPSCTIQVPILHRNQH